MTYDAVWTVNHHPSLCGTAKFSHQLAQRLGVPCYPLDVSPLWRIVEPPLIRSQYPLISVRASELPSGLYDLPETYDVFWHDYDFAEIRHYITEHAERVYAANVTIADQIRPMRPDVIEAWCPSTIQGNPHRGTINVLTFGMAHKIQTARYDKLKTLLDATGEDYTVSVSTAIHEGSPWDETAKVAERLRTIFGGSLRVLGYLADDALAKELQDCSAVALFFDPALRANNTTAWAVCEARKPLITNVDTHSPLCGAYDIELMDAWPMWPSEMGWGRAPSWERLIELVSEVPCAS